MGSTIRHKHRVTLQWNHPHIHGEYLAPLIVPVVMLESSPYTWGVPSHFLVTVFISGIIPIYMGSTSYFGATFKRAGNHPHIHGEYQKQVGRRQIILESSPYTWGVQEDKIEVAEDSRIIPIYMGSTFECQSTFLIIKNHPHIHGEYSCKYQIAYRPQESSPYTWGVPYIKDEGRLLNGIIPIYMGSTTRPIYTYK